MASTGDARDFSTNRSVPYLLDEGPLHQNASARQKAFQQLRMKLTWVIISPNGNPPMLNPVSPVGQEYRYVNRAEWMGLCRLAQPDIFTAFTVETIEDTLDSKWVQTVEQDHGLVNETGQWLLWPLKTTSDIHEDLAKACWPNWQPIIELLNGKQQFQSSIVMGDFYHSNDLAFHPQVALHQVAQLLWPTKVEEKSESRRREAHGIVSRSHIIKSTFLHRHWVQDETSTHPVSIWPTSFLQKAVMDESLVKSLAKALGISSAFLLWLLVSTRQEALNETTDNGADDLLREVVSQTDLGCDSITVYTLSRVRERSNGEPLDLAAGTPGQAIEVDQLPEDADVSFSSSEDSVIGPRIVDPSAPTKANETVFENAEVVPSPSEDSDESMPPTSGRSTIVETEPKRRDDLRSIMKGQAHETLKQGARKGQLTIVWYNESAFEVIAHPVAPAYQLGLTKEWIKYLNMSQPPFGQLEVVDSWKRADDNNQKTFCMFWGDDVLHYDINKLLETGEEVDRKAYPFEIRESMA